ncbi:MAG: DUF2797 domain-containing protein [Gammaproteobacteria bacterium]|nr:DUF2797 domain-containing protein [Gammaproteobacteria bacterium]
MKLTGTLQKMATELKNPVQYSLQLGEQTLVLNELLGQDIELTFTGNIYCIHCQRKITKSFQQGYCYPCFQRLRECNLCIIHPERCQVEHGTCPKDDWAHAHCYQQHIVYLANSSALKVGITRHTNQPSRWIDQGACQALPIFTASNRYQSGVIEVALKNYVNDKTNWRTMLKQVAEPVDLQVAREELLQQAEAEIKAAMVQFPTGQIDLLPDAKVVEINYPVNQYLEKIKSLSLDKTPDISARLMGVKGQYLIFEEAVMNVRKFGGYEVTLTY